MIEVNEPRRGQGANSQITLRFRVGDRRVAVQKHEEVFYPYTLLGKFQTEAALGRVAEEMLRKGVRPVDVADSLGTIASDSRMDLTMLYDFLSLASRYISKSSEPAMLLRDIAEEICAMPGPATTRSFAAFKLFKEACP